MLVLNLELHMVFTAVQLQLDMLSQVAMSAFAFFLVCCYSLLLKLMFVMEML